VVLASATVSAQAQSRYYYPASVISVPAGTSAATTTPGYYYYWPSGYRGRTAWTGYPAQYYRTAYTPQYYQTAYSQSYYPTTFYSQTSQPAAGGTVIPASYVTTETSQASATTETPQTAGTVEAPQAAATTETSQTDEGAVAQGDPYGFTTWLNATRASYGLSAVGYDPNLSSWAAVNNTHQASRGIGHFVMGPARRQNSAMGAFPGIESMWMASPAHRAALLDPTIRWIGIAGLGAYWTFNAN
jgi:hypothetical protein